jgi:hypothetical protein
MPLIQVSAPQDTLDKREQDVLMSRLSNAVLKAENAPIDDSGAQSLVWAYYDEKPKASIYVGGENLEEPPFAHCSDDTVWRTGGINKGVFSQGDRRNR